MLRYFVLHCCSVVPLSMLLLLSPALAADVSPSELPPSQDTQPVFELRVGADQQAISRADIESQPLYEVSLSHFEGPKGRFAGVWLDDFLAAHDLDTAARLRFIAHDDYTIFLTTADRQEKRYLLATRLDGEPLTLGDFGPTMLLVPADAEAVEAGNESMVRWIWSIREIRAQ